MEITFNQLPPSENKIRIIRVIRGRPGGMAYTKDAVNYKKDFKAFLLKNYSAKLVNFASEHTMQSTYEIRIDLFFPIEQLVNKGWPKTKTYFKKMDVGNRRKLLEDCLSESLGIDDMYTFDLRMVKQATAGDPYLTIKITRTNEEDYGL